MWNSLLRRRDNARRTLLSPLHLLQALIVVALPLLLLFNTSLGRFLQFYFFVQNWSDAAQTVATNGAEQWVGDNKITPPITMFTPVYTTNAPAVSPLFASTYQKYETSPSTNSLGTPITVAFPSVYGWLQFFTSDALLLPASHYADTRYAADPFTDLIHYGIRDAQTGVVRLPLLRALLTSGSPLPLDGVGSSLSYVDLRRATNPTFMRFAPDAASTPAPASQKQWAASPGSHDTFIQTGIRSGKMVGHIIPPAIWDYLHQPSVSPNSWERDFGAPLTEAIAFTLPVNGQIHHMLIQAFAHDAITLDQDMLTLSQSLQHGTPLQANAIHVHLTGVDYLQTLGLPSVTLKSLQYVWSLQNITVLDAASDGHVLAHVEQNFPFILLGDTSWHGGMLWYHVSWSLPKGTKSGWLPASSITFQSPGNVPGQASFDALSPGLASYLSGLGDNTGVVAYDITRQRYYIYNGSLAFLAASSIKVPIMLTFLDMIEQQGRDLGDDEMNLLTTMIENSNNDSASILYNAVNGSQGINDYMQHISVSSLSPDDDAWGYSEISPQAMVTLLTLLYDGKILSENHRTLALNLMEHVEADQQLGVGDTAPEKARVALKDGWVTGPDNLWAVNSSGIVTTDDETYIVSVYTQEQPSLDTGQATIRSICSNIAALLQP